MFNTNTMFASLLWSSIGMGCVIYGKKQSEAVPLIGGFALLGVSYLIGSVLLMSGISIALILGMIYFVKQGY